MAYELKISNAPGEVLSNPHAFLYGLVQHLEATRFLVLERGVKFIPRSQRPRKNSPVYQVLLWMSKIRLRTSKPYCGNHPGPCALSSHRPERKGRFLEGSDWVELNDVCNSYLDQHSVEALIRSRPLELRQPLIIRQGRLRRLHYGCSYPFPNGNAVWEPEGVPEDYGDYHGRTDAPRSTFPEQTPGIFFGQQTQEAH